MRPQILFPLFADITTLRGIGPRLAPIYQRLVGKHVVDLLWHLPVGVVDRAYSPKLKYADRDRVVTLTLDIVEHAPPKNPRLPYRIVGADDTDQVTITYFNAKGDYLAKLYPTNQKIVVSGLLERFRGGWSMSHPDYAVPVDRAGEIPGNEPIYGLSEGVSGKMLRKSVTQALAKLPVLPEWHDASLLAREKWPDWKTALLAVHSPSPVSPEEAENESPARRRLAYDELLADQLALAVIRRHHRAGSGRALISNGALQKKLEASLPFALTAGQRQAISEISADIAAPKRMLRLLQGDVGAGKTIVALMAMLQAVEAGTQAVLMAPTEILARQHHARLTQFLQPLGIECGIVVGKSRGVANSKDRNETLAQLADGSLQLVVGTHALFQDDVAFHDLGLAVVDEQHRFGVNQRLQLSDKGRGVDILVMTATPIPRTLTLTAYGDMDVSRLTDKPAGRQPIDTRLIDMARLDEVIAGVKRHIDKGAQAYWVCPLVEELETSDLAAASERAELLADRLGKAQIGLIHGRLNSEAKDRVMTAFAAGEIKVLVATTVIEVGVDVPQSTLMIIEHAERFGLAQLHQLRGRVGRGSDKSVCLLMYQAPLGQMAKSRLKMLRETEDGFRIAEEDLRLRGPGEMLGTRQSGMPEFRLADLAKHQELLAMAHDDVQLILNRDPHLESARGQALRTLLYLFERDAAVPLFRAG
jgi:ATP-dependent DNA helicase RecG